jgi:hypothetical protein
MRSRQFKNWQKVTNTFSQNIQVILKLAKLELRAAPPLCNVVLQLLLNYYSSFKLVNLLRIFKNCLSDAPAATPKKGVLSQETTLPVHLLVCPTCCKLLCDERIFARA